MSQAEFVTVIIPVRNDSVRLGMCLEALARQEGSTPEFEIIVVDNGSTDSPGDIVQRYPRTRMASEPFLASNRARNHGIALARGETLAFTDSDCLPRPDWIRRGLERMRRLPEVGLVAGRVEVFAHDPAAPSLAEAHDLVLAFPQERCVRRSYYGATANLFTSREVFQAVGLFRDDLDHGGDAEWGQRVHRSGREVVYAHEVRVAHPARRTIADLIARTRRGAAGMVAWRRTEPGRIFWDMAKDLVPPPDLLWEIATSPRVSGIPSRLGILLVFSGLRQVRFWERWRLLLGGAPVR